MSLALTKEDLTQLANKIAEVGILKAKGIISQDDIKRLGKEFEVIFKKLEKQEKELFKSAQKAVNAFLKSGAIDEIVECLKTLKEKYG